MPTHRSLPTDWLDGPPRDPAGRPLPLPDGAMNHRLRRTRLKGLNEFPNLQAAKPRPRKPDPVRKPVTRNQTIAVLAGTVVAFACGALHLL